MYLEQETKKKYNSFNILWRERRVIFQTKKVIV